MIIKNIIEFLKDENSVFINDLGLFKKVYVGAQMVDGMIQPPHYHIILEKYDSGNGFAFILFVSKQEQLRIVEADMAIKHWLDDLKNRISATESAIYEGFGVFRQGKDAFEFKSDFISALNIDFEGMESILLEPATIKIEQEKVPDNISDVPPTTVAIEIPETAKIDEPTIEDTVLVEPPSKKGKKIGSFILFIAIILGSIILMLYLFRDILELKWKEIKWKQENTEQPIVQSIDTSEIYQENAVLQEDSVSISEPQKDTIENAMIEPTVVDDSGVSKEFKKIHFEIGKYYVIAGSFDTEKRAFQHAALKQKQGFQPVFLYQEGTYKIRICVGIYQSEDEALRSIPQGADFWVLK